MDKSQLRELAIVRGKQAQTVLENPAFVAAFDQVKDELFARFMATGPEDQILREKAWAVFQGLSEIHGTLSAFVETARMESENKKLDAQK